MTEQEFAYLSDRIRGKLVKLALRFNRATGLDMMLLDIGDIESIEAVPKDSYAILTAHLKDGSTCSYILKCNDAEGPTTLLAYNKKQLKK